MIWDLIGFTLFAFAAALLLAWGAVFGSDTHWMVVDYTPDGKVSGVVEQATP